MSNGKVEKRRVPPNVIIWNNLTRTICKSINFTAVFLCINHVFNNSETYTDFIFLNVQ